mmetsp:Transcript_27670/g.70549  ORF Transcript_27670/g.70549 Transcript_27670/m.70549 type:complete len:85 (+) Transcript_27670:270-524(+)
MLSSRSPHGPADHRDGDHGRAADQGSFRVAWPWVQEQDALYAMQTTTLTPHHTYNTCMPNDSSEHSLETIDAYARICAHTPALT